jgi:hypothetical protein
MRRIVVALGVIAVLGTTGIGVTAHAQAYLAADEARNVQQVNGTRTSKGLKPLASHSGLQSMARAQAVRMMQRGSIYHNPHLSADITALGVNWRMVGENVGMGPDSDAIEDALLKSPHHYENITRPNFNTIGVGVVKSSDGKVFLVQVFAEIVAAAPKPVVRPVTAAPAAPKPVVRPSAAPQTVRPAAPKPRPKPVVRRPDPNALLGGRIVTADLPQASIGRVQTLGVLRPVLYALSLWS